MTQENLSMQILTIWMVAYSNQLTKLKTQTKTVLVSNSMLVQWRREQAIIEENNSTVQTKLVGKLI